MRFFYLFLVIIPFNLIAQDSLNTHRKKWSLGIVASPDYSYRTLTHRNSQSSNTIVDYRNTYEQPKYGGTMGINASYFFRKHFSVEIGINYANRGYKTKEYTDFIAAMPNDPLIPEKVEYVNNYHCIYIPIVFNYTAGSNKLRFIAGIGMAPLVLIARKVTQTTVYMDGSTTVSKYRSEMGFSKLNLAGQINAGIDLVLSPKFNLRIQPVFRFDSGIFQTSPIKEHLWSAGINTGLFLGL